MVIFNKNSQKFSQKRKMTRRSVFLNGQINVRLLLIWLVKNILTRHMVSKKIDSNEKSQTEIWQQYFYQYFLD